MLIEEKDLQSALTKAAQELNCSVVDLEYELVQRPSRGFLGFFQKNAIIEARAKKKAHKYDEKKSHKKKENFKSEKKHREAKHHFEHKQTQENQPSLSKEKAPLKAPEYKVKNEAIFDDFHKESKEKYKIEDCIDEISLDLKNLLNSIGLDIEVSEVSIYDKDCVYIKLDGADAALLIGKEAYRYKALSYLLHNWINSKYKFLVRLEIAEFLKNQEQGMELYLKNIIEKVEHTGKAQTKHLDGVLVKIALEKLRQRFPNKYVGIRQNADQRFVVVNDFFKKDE
ncbi:hypothetical protein DMB92_01605 [Campylobacter sp. MIT 99-7217]|uniref:Jag N-terminal domain-containing protein n=1 Tax=Campylobacter sp. MIT 99-7217 TaxID=535091 RepID=UPI00115AE274|nr:Jag N-terminal domain-containing protein [Campylobacter sp. MIT 99-7217]TQR34682.1 hypothetical protein DMB92_01605 [Campylobacter sp. MIT 99-7217]